jgi:hypothetical protein
VLRFIVGFNLGSQDGSFKVGLFQSIVSGTFSHAADTVDPLKEMDDRGYKLRKNFEQIIRAAITAEYKDEAVKIAESVTGYAFDFGDFDFDQRTTAVFKKACENTMRNAYMVLDIPPEQITAAIIHRGYRQGRSTAQVVGQLVNLFDLGVAIIGERAKAAGPLLFTVHKDLFTAVITIQPPPERLARHLTMRSDAQRARDAFAGKTTGAPGAAPPAAPAA